MLNFLELLRLGGLGLGYLAVVLLGVVIGCMGFYFSKKDKETTKNKYWIFFWFFLFLLVCYFFSIPAFLNGEGKKGSILVVIILILSFIAIFALFEKSSKTALARNRDHIGWKLLFIGTSAAAGFTLSVIFALSAIDTLFFSQLNQKQKAEWWISEKILKQDSSQENIEEALKKIKKYNYPPSPFVGIANLKLGNISQASKNFRDYANSRQREGKHFWLGAANYYQGKFSLAAQEFELAEKPDLLLVALFKSGNLNQQRLNELKEKSGLDPVVLDPIVSEIEKTLLPKMPEKKEKGFEELVWEKLNNLEKLISKPGPEQTPVTLDERINKMVFARILTYEQTPVLPKVNTDKIYWFMATILPVLLTMMFITNAVIRDHLWQKIESRKWAGKIGRLAKKLSWHSWIARKTTVKIALMEKEKGMFSQEIEKIQQAVFPLDAILSLFYLRKTKRILKNWEINSQEKEDIRYIYQEIRKLAGKLIPQGSEESLIVITALRKKASQITRAYLKKNTDYQSARISLLATLDELTTVGDILEARKAKNQINYYSLLGIGPRAETEEIKKAYRSVIFAIHPDHHHGNPHLQSLATMVNVAYTTLSNGTRKEIYDKQMGF
jgi:hypothetical protein